MIISSLRHEFDFFFLNLILFCIALQRNYIFPDMKGVLEHLPSDEDKPENLGSN